MADANDILATRRHRFVADRAERIRLNSLVLDGGDAYIDARLCRLPYESDQSWGGAAAQPSETRFSASPIRTTPGRRQRAFLVNYAARIASKLDQYVFAQLPGREGVDPDFAADASRTGLSINDVMAAASRLVTACRWCWIGVDRSGLDPVDPAAPRSLADREALGERIFWTVWRPDEVVDWHIDQRGTLAWLITEQTQHDAADPMREPRRKTLRTLWMPGGGARLTIADGKVEGREEFKISAGVVPFVPVGVPSASPWWFDDVESIQASLLNLDSVHGENLFQSVYPQLVLPAGIIADIQQALQCSGEAAIEMVRGLQYPILEPSNASGQTRYLTPSASDLAAIPNEIQRRRRELYDVVGMALQNETRQVASAEAKAWDHLDPEMVIRQRAILLESAERRAVAISSALDTTFPVYEPQYAKSFDVSDLAADVAAITQLNGLELPEDARRELQRAAVEVLDKMIGIPPERKAMVMNAIDMAVEMPLETPQTPMPGPEGEQVGGAVTPSATVQDTALNGAQVQSLVSILAQVAAGELPYDSAIPVIQSAFPAMRPEMIDRMVSPLRRFTPAAPAPAQ